MMRRTIALPIDHQLPHKNGSLKQSGQYRGGYLLRFGGGGNPDDWALCPASGAGGTVNNRRCGVWLRYARNGILIGSTLYLDKEKVMWHRDTW